EHRLFRIASQDLAVELADFPDQFGQHFHELGPQDVVAGLVHDEPGTGVVVFELGQKLRQVTQVHGGSG
nr:hypothetical protein [Tanacetum cinerariifolium]